MSDLFEQPAETPSGSAETAPPRPALLWLDPEQAALLRSVADHAGLEVVQAGMPASARRSASSDVLDAFENAQPFDDLRHAVASTEARVVLLASGGEDDRGASMLDDFELVQTCRERGIALFAMEPSPGSVVDLSKFEAAEGIDPVRMVPMLRDSRVFGDAMELLDQLGRVRTVAVSARCGPRQGTLGARLYDAMAIVHALLGLPDRIDASVVTGVTGSGVYQEPATSIRKLRGDLTANIRFAGGRAASLALSDRAGAWARGVTVLGEKGCLRVNDAELELTGINGELLDRSSIAPTFAGAFDQASGGPDRAAAIIADQLKRALDVHAPQPTPMDRARVLAMCEAAILSARTGEAEYPQTILQMGGQR
ncbi:MAG: hypothetical protein ABL309_10075 [Phycisphaerales bacterium]